MSAAAADADARVHQSFERATKETFVQAMLSRVADGLASDAPFGYNSANQIRGRVEAIADDAEASAGRKVLEARFAMGSDDSQYLSQAVTLLWAGDGGERLRVVPAPMMPEIMRHASAEGIVLAMQRVMKEKKSENIDRAKRGLELAAWLLQVPEIRAAVVDAMSEPWQPELVKSCATTLQNEYLNSGPMQGAAWVGKRLEGDTESADYADRLAVVETLLTVLHALTSEDGLPMRMVAHHQQNAALLVRNAALDSAAVLGMADAGVLGVPPNVRFADVATVDAAAQSAAAAGPRFCVTYNSVGQPVKTPQVDQPEQSVFQSALLESYDRIAGRQETRPVVGSNVAVSEQTRPNDSIAPDIKMWKLDRVVSPLYTQGSTRSYGMKTVYDPPNPWTARDDELVEPRAAYTAAKVSAEMSIALSTTLSTKGPIDSIAPRRDGRLGPESLFVDFCLVRGLCGFFGPHQQATAAAASNPALHPPLEYHYPTVPMANYTQGSLMRLHDAPISSEMLHAARDLQKRLYGSPEGLLDKLRTDFVGDVVDVATESEVARPALWAPVPWQEAGTPDLSLDDEVAMEACAAATYEFMSESFKKNAASFETRRRPATHVKLLRAAAAAAKIMQLSPMTTVHSELQDARFVTKPSDSPEVTYVTRPVQRCKDAKPLDDRVRVPVDVGLARFIRLSDSAGTGARGPTPPPPLEVPAHANSDKSYVAAWDTASSAVQPVLVDNTTLDGWLQGGVEAAWPGGASAWTLERSFSMYVGAAADSSPVSTANVEAAFDARDCPVAREMAAADLEASVVQNALAGALMATRELEQVEHEDAYIQKLRTKGSAEQQGVFGVKAMAGNIEDASRDRRMGVWSDALREVSVSGDRLYRFVTQLTGAIGESADSAISWEDEDLKQMSKEAAARQKALAERVARFQTKLVESVVSSTLKASKLQLEVRGGSSGDGHDGELVVLSGEVKDNLRQVMAGEGGHGLFEANVELNDLLGTAARPMHIGHIVNKLQAVSQEYHNQVAHDLTPNVPASYARVVEPRNSFMMHLKPDTSNAIQKAFDYITAEMRHCDGLHRHIYLWEFVEGRDWALVTRFAELVGLMLQNTRMRSGSFAAYVGNAQLITNTQNIRTQLQRLRSQVCTYLSTQHNAPLFLHENGRTHYFGGSVKPTSNADVKRVSKVRKTDAESPFDSHPAVDDLDPSDKTSRDAMRRKLLARLRRMALARRNSAAAARRSPTSEAASRWARASGPSDAGGVDHMTSLHWHGRKVLKELLLDADGAAMATEEELELRLRVLLQLRLTVSEGAGDAKLQLASPVSHDLYVKLHADLQANGSPPYGILASDDGFGDRLPLPSSRDRVVVLDGVEHHFVDLQAVTSDSPFLKEPPDQEVLRSHVSLALDAVFGLPNDLQWKQLDANPTRWVRRNENEHVPFQRATVHWHKTAADFAKTHKLPLPAVLMAWCAELMIACTGRASVSDRLARAAEKVCDAASYQAHAYVQQIRLDVLYREFADRAQALVYSFDMEKHSMEPTRVRTQCMQDIRNPLTKWMESPEGLKALGEERLVDEKTGNAQLNQIAAISYEAAVVLRASDETFTPYALATRMTITQPRRVLLRLLEHVLGTATAPMRAKYLASLGSGGSKVLPPENDAAGARRVLRALADKLAADEVRAPEDFAPKTTFGDWLELRLRAEQQPYELIALVSVQSTSLRSLGLGTSVYADVLRQISGYSQQAAKERASSAAFLADKGAKLFATWYVPESSGPAALNAVVANGTDELLINLRHALRTTRLALAEAEAEAWRAENRPRKIVS